MHNIPADSSLHACMHGSTRASYKGCTDWQQQVNGDNTYMTIIMWLKTVLETVASYVACYVEVSNLAWTEVSCQLQANYMH